MTIKDRLVSIIRTFTPQIVGAFLTWLGAKLGIKFPEAVAVELQFLAVEAVALGYYALIRWVETHVPNAGWFLGYAAQPVYVSAPNVPEAQATGMVPLDK